MDVLEKCYDKRTFTLFALIADVPGKCQWTRNIFITFCTLALTIGVTFQVLKFIVEGLKLPLIIDLLPTTIAGCGCLIYIFYIVCMAQGEYAVLLTIMYNDMKEERPQEEDAIKKRYANAANMFVNVYTTLMLLAICGYPLSSLAPQFLDSIIPLNESRKKQFVYEGEFILDRDKYYYIIYFIESCSVFAVCVLIGASENMFVIVMQHICSMFAIIGYRLDNIVTVKNYKTLTKFNHKDLIKRRLQICIQDHQKSLRFADLIDSFYDIPLTLTLLSTFCALTVSLVQVTDPKLISGKMIIFTTIQITQLFILSYMGQNLINVSEHLSENMYHTRWYTCPPAVQKLMQLIILRSSKSSEIVPRRMYKLSVQSFLSVIQTVVSFFMVLRKAS